MKFYVHTNIDKWKFTKWPERFCYPPKVGEMIEGIGPGEYRPRLEVISITHTWDKYQECPIVDIELHIPHHLNASLKDLGWDK
jgi:hypothetical protein